MLRLCAIHTGITELFLGPLNAILDLILLYSHLIQTPYPLNDNIIRIGVTTGGDFGYTTPLQLHRKFKKNERKKTHLAPLKTRNCCRFQETSGHFIQ